MLEYILGFVLGDGNISKSGSLVRLYDQNYEFVSTTLRNAFVNVFDVNPSISFDRFNNSYVLHKWSKRIWTQLHSLGVPAGKKARIITVPETIKLGTVEQKSSFISGVFDAEGSLTSFSEKRRHPTGYPYFEVKMYSPRFIDDLQSLLTEVSVEFSPRIYHYNYGSILRLNGKKQIELIWSHLKLLHPRFLPAR
jgi:intein/homing endonuclease